MQTAKGIGDNGIWRIGKLNGILFLPDVGSNYNARRVIIGIELAQKIHERQFAIPIPWQSNPAVIWRHVIAA